MAEQPPPTPQPEASAQATTEAGAAASQQPGERARNASAPPVTTALADVRSRLKNLLLQPEASAAFPGDIARLVQTLCEAAGRNPDICLFQLMHDSSSKFAAYSVTHALQCALACGLVAAHLGWSQARRESLVCAALTMNIAMSKVQGELAAQTTPPTDEQRQTIREHPTKGADMLEKLGVTDADWLRAVREHHETPEGAGYPNGIAAAFEAAELLRHIDVFLAKIKSRASRKALPPNSAIHQIFTRNANSPIAAAIVKVFGLYPPGVYVRLASGELAVVIARGEAVNKPVVAVIVNKNGNVPPRPIRRDTTDPQFGVSAVVDSSNVMVQTDPEKLYDWYRSHGRPVH